MKLLWCNLHGLCGYDNIKFGIIFRTVNGLVWNCSAIWRSILKLCEQVGVDASKVKTKILNYFSMNIIL